MTDFIARLRQIEHQLADLRADLEAHAIAAPVELPTAPPATRPRLALVVGHDAKSPGAYGVAPISANEYAFNRDLAQRIEAVATAAGRVEVRIFYRDGVGIAGAYRAVAAWGADAAIELHFNAVGGNTASGAETLVRHGASPILRSFAGAVQAAMVAALGLPDRGVKEPWQGRGDASLTAIDAPTILVEPFFGSTPGNASRATERKHALAVAIAGAATGWLIGSPATSAV